jgi:hypothetical protein
MMIFSIGNRKDLKLHNHAIMRLYLFSYTDVGTGVELASHIKTGSNNSVRTFSNL